MVVYIFFYVYRPLIYNKYIWYIEISDKDPCTLSENNIKSEIDKLFPKLSGKYVFYVDIC